MIKTIEQYCTQHDLLKRGSCIIIGLSGGPDSVFLLHVLNQLKDTYNLTLVAAHLDHGWRTDSNKDVQFCTSLCSKLGITFESAHINDLNVPFKNKGSLEEFGRNARRYYFEQLAKKYNANAIALGHHANDQQETFFIRLVRGTTLSGLVGIQPKDGLYIRPLLHIYKNSIISYLTENNIEYVIDPSNESQSFLRNRIRTRVLPELKQCDDRFNTNFLRTLTNLNEAEKTLETITYQAYNAMRTIDGNIAFIDISMLKTYSEYMQKRIIVMWLLSHNITFTLTENYLNEILRFLYQPGSKTHQISTQWSIVKKKNLASIIVH